MFTKQTTPIIKKCEINENLNEWDFVEVYGNLCTILSDFKFEPEKNNYYFSLATGTHVELICWSLLIYKMRFPFQLVQLTKKEEHWYNKVSKDVFHQIFQPINQSDEQKLAGTSDKNDKVYQMSAELIRLIKSPFKEPILLLGETGVGKTRIANEIRDILKIPSEKIQTVNCATLTGDLVNSTLFGHKKGAFTGADDDRDGILKLANGGIVFLDEIGCLPLETQAKLLKAIEEKSFRPVGGKDDEKSDFRLISGTNADLSEMVKNGQFREDLLARISMWQYMIPSLSERPECIEDNLKNQINDINNETHQSFEFDKNAKKLFIEFAKSKDTPWCYNFRDFNATVRRMCFYAYNSSESAHRITSDIVQREIGNLRKQWEKLLPNSTTLSKCPESIESKPMVHEIITSLLPNDRFAKLNRFDLVGLYEVIEVCVNSKNLAETGCKLFNTQTNKAKNPSDRISKYLSKYGLNWKKIKDRSKTAHD